MAAMIIGLDLWPDKEGRLAAIPALLQPMAEDSLESQVTQSRQPLMEGQRSCPEKFDLNAGGLLEIINLDQTQADAAVLPSEDRGELSGRQ